MTLLATRQRPSTSAPSDGSRTITLTGAPPLEEEDSQPSGESSTVGRLRLQGGPRRHRRRVEWGESVVDNEDCGRKSSKTCCIYHRPKLFDESSSEESSSDSDSDSSCHHGHSHSQRSADGTPSDGQSTRERQSDGVVVVERNAYETMPSTKKGKTKANPTSAV